MMKILKFVTKKLVELNLFVDVKTLQEQNKNKIRNQILATRLYLLFFITALIVLVLFNSISTKLISVTELEPTIETYDRLYTAYPNTLSCSCKLVSIPYSAFITMEYVQHPICTSDLVSSKWIDSLFNSNTSHLSPIDFRLTAAAQFRILKAMCSLVDQGVKYLRRSALWYALMSSKVLPRQSLDSQLDAVVAKFNGLVQITLLSSRAPQLIMMIIRQSRINSAVHTDAFHFSEPGSNQYKAINSFYPLYDNISYNNDTMDDNFAFCNPFSTATYKAGIYDWSGEFRSYFQMMNPTPSARFIIPGMNVGCLPYDAISSSTLECFFSSECLNDTAQWISNLPPSDWPKPLNSSQLTTFSLNSIIESMMDKQMIDQWNNTIDFTTYYKACAPTQCTYTFVGSENLLYVIALIIGLIGSLNIGFRIMAPLMIQFGHYITGKVFNKSNKSNVSSDNAKQNKLSVSDVESAVTTDAFDICVSTIELKKVSSSVQDSNQSDDVSAFPVITKIKNFILTFNLFQDDIDEPLSGIYATYMYAMLLTASVTILGVYSLLTVQTHSVTVSTPSVSTFESLYEIHSETLNCPCSELAIPNKNMFILSDPVYHQICSSAFLTQVWLDGFFTINFIDESDRRPIPDDDFRKNGRLFFYAVMSLCNFAQNSVEKSKELFLIEQYSTMKVLSRLEFELNANLDLVKFREMAKRTWQVFVSVMRTLLVSSGLEGGTQFQSVDINGKTVLQRYLPGPSGYNACACSVARNCPDSEWSGGQLLCYYGNNCTAGSMVWSIPGFIKACTFFDSLLGSDLRCFFNDTCLNTLRSMYNIDMPKRQPLPSATVNITVLNSSTLVSFLPTDTFAKILDELMIDSWQMRSNFDGYYNSCAPLSCTYTVTRRWNILYAFTMVTTFFGGLVVTFRLLIPICVSFIYWIVTHRRNARSATNNQRSPTNSYDFLQWYNVSKASIERHVRTMNLFKKESILNQAPNTESMSSKASRMYVILLSLSVLTIIVFKCSDQTTVSETVSFPSLATYEQLQVKYPNTLWCTCEQIGTLLKTFISIKPTLHQVCSSDFINQSWITLFYGYNNSINTYQKLDRPLLSKYLQILSWLCDEAQNVIDFWTFQFENVPSLNSFTYTRSVFDLYMNNAIANLRSDATVHFKLIIPFVTELFEGNLLPTVFNTDWTIEYGNESNGYLTQSIPRLYMNNTCNCVVSNSCQDHLRIGPPDLIIPGLVVGCSPIEGLRMSTLECFYSSDCISTIFTYLEYYTQTDGSPPNSFQQSTVPLSTFDPLDNFTKSRFLPNTSISTLINEMFIEDWNKNASYETYFKACSPDVCRYEYTKRQDILYVTTSLLALYGGLTVGWRFIVWNGLKVYHYIKHKYLTRKTIVQPISNTK